MLLAETSIKSGVTLEPFQAILRNRVKDFLIHRVSGECDEVLIISQLAGVRIHLSRPLTLHPSNVVLKFVQTYALAN